MTKPNTPRSGPLEPLSRLMGGNGGPAECLFCGQPIQLRHRRTKKFCGDLCRSRFHYARRQAAQADLKRRLEEAEARLRQLEQAQGETTVPSVV